MEDHLHGKKWILFFSLLFISDLFLEALFMFIRPMHVEFNDLIGDMLGVYTNYILLLMLLFLIPLVYAGFFIIKYAIQIKREHEIRPLLVNKILSIFFLVFIVGLLVALIVVAGENAVIIFYVLEYYLPFISIVLIIASLLLLYAFTDEVLALFKKPAKKSFISQAKRILPLVGTFLFFSWLLIMPLVFQPVYVIRSELPPKPLLIAHRGGARYAPENTIAAAMYVNQIGVDGWEIDVQISNDGIPFLMHDGTLQRTTNVSEAFPSRAEDSSSSFNISDLKTLNAGEWFLEEDPYGLISKDKVPTNLFSIYQNASIPTLEEALIYSKSASLLVNVDFKAPPNTHPFYEQFFNISLAVLIAANYDSNIWVTSYEREWLDLVLAQAPDMTTALSIDFSDNIDAEEFQATGYDMINSAHEKPNSVFRDYYNNNVSINVWTVNMASRFQQLWALGVTSVTTDEPIIYQEIDNPVLLITEKTYVSVWVVSYLLAVAVVLFVKRYFMKKKSKELTLKTS